jgi:hypothetical protein
MSRQEDLVEEYAVKMAKKKLAEVGHAGNIDLAATIEQLSPLKTKVHGYVNVVGVVEFDYYIILNNKYYSTQASAEYMDIYLDNEFRVVEFDLTRFKEIYHTIEEMLAAAIAHLTGLVAKPAFRLA